MRYRRSQMGDCADICIGLSVVKDQDQTLLLGEGVEVVAKVPRIQHFQHLGFLRMKPHFPHLDRDNKRKRDSAKQEDGSDEDELPATKAQQVTVRFANRGGDSERWAKAKEASFRTLMAMDAQEPWVECDWHGKSSELSDVRFYSHFFMHKLLTTYLTS